MTEDWLQKARAWARKAQVSGENWWGLPAVPVPVVGGGLGLAHAWEQLPQGKVMGAEGFAIDDKKWMVGASEGSTDLNFVPWNGSTSTWDASKQVSFGADGRVTMNGPTTVSGDLRMTGRDLVIDNAARRGGAGGATRRALVHDGGDRLTLNWGNDYTGGVRVTGNTEVLGNLTASGTLTGDRLCIRGKCITDPTPVVAQAAAPAATGNKNIKGTLDVEGKLKVRKGDGNWNWIQVAGNQGDNLYLGGDSTNRGIWADGNRDLTLYNQGKAGLRVRTDGTTGVDSDLTVGGNAILGGDNSWILHTPDDGRQNFYIAHMDKARRDWDWGNQMRLDPDGSVNVKRLRANQAMGVGDDMPSDWTGANFKRRDGRWSHFDWVGDGKNYIRGDLQVDGNTCITYGPGNRYRFCFQGDGNVVQYKDGQAVWATMKYG